MTFWDGIWNDPLYRVVVSLSFGLMLGLTALLAVIWMVRLIRHRRRAINNAMVEDVSAALMAYLGDAIDLNTFIARTSHFSVYQRATILERYVATLTGESETKLARYFEASGMLRAAERLTRSPIWWRRLEGARLLGSGGYNAGANALLDLLHDRRLAVRLAAARGLGRTQDPEYIAPLLRALRRGQLSRAAIAEVLVTFGPTSRERLRDLVMQLPDDPRAAILRATTVEVLALVGDAGATPFIQYALASNNTEVRIAAFKAAGIIRAGISSDELRSGLQDPSWQIRAHAASTAGKNKADRLIPDLAQLLGDTSWWVRMKAAYALDSLGEPGRHMLERIAQTHDDEYARGMALRVLTEDPEYADLLRVAESARSGKRAFPNDAIPAENA